MNKLKMLLVFLLLAITLGACKSQVTPAPLPANEDATPQPSAAPSQTPTLTSEPTTTATLLPPTSTPMLTPTSDPILLDPAYNPLTGLLVNNSALLDRRPLMIKVSNWPRLGRPHAGLSSADIVFEYYIGAFMNRFLAIYYGQDAAKIGPVRSGRLVDSQLTNLYQGILIYGDADELVDQSLFAALGEWALPFHILPCPAMCGQATHSATGVFANATELTRYVVEQGIDNARPDLAGMHFQSEPPVGDELGTLVSFVYADFSLVEWRYNPELGVYHLWQDSELPDGRITKAPTYDRNNDKPLSFENIIIVYTNYITFTPSKHDIELNNVSSFQSALFFRDGIMCYGTWKAVDPQSPLQFFTSDGAPMPLKPGQTWIILAGNHTITEQVSPGAWDFYFNTP